MKRYLLLFGLILPFVAQARIYITVAGANVERAKLAIGSLHTLGAVSPSSIRMAQNLSEAINEDLTFTSLFDFIDRSSFASLDTKGKLYEMGYEEWGLTGATFALKLAFQLVGPKVQLEALLYDIPGKNKIFGTRYEYDANQYWKVVHSLSEDILKALTGESGLFNSRILMVCVGQKDKRGQPTKEIWIADADGRNMKPITTDRRLSLTPSWAPDGRTITYTQYQMRPVRQIKSLASGKTPKGPPLQILPVLLRHDLSTGKRVIISERKGMNSGASWSPDGTKIALTLSFTGRPEIYMMPSGGGNPTPISRDLKIKRVTGDGYQPNYPNLLFDVEPDFASDGRRLVFSSARTGHPMIYTIDLATMEGKQLTFAGTYNSSPKWAPKQDRIVFAAQRIGAGNFDLYYIDADGTNLSRLTKGGLDGKMRVNSENPTWAPTGRHLAYASNRTGRYAIYVSTLDGGFVKQISPPEKECTLPAWGPSEK